MQKVPLRKGKKEQENRKGKGREIERERKGESKKRGTGEGSTLMFHELTNKSIKLSSLVIK